jgi:hypothetical protein
VDGDAEGQMKEKQEMKIEKGIPMPHAYPFAQMEVGDSFVLPTNIKRVTAWIAAKRYADKHNVEFATRTTEDGSIRLWRIK